MTPWMSCRFPAEAGRDRELFSAVIPAEAGIQRPKTRHSPLDSRLRGNDGNREVGKPKCDCPRRWAGPRRRQFGWHNLLPIRDSPARGQGNRIWRDCCLRLPLSFPRKRESSAPKPVTRPWIPAGAGMTATERSENPNDIALPLKGGEEEKSKTAGNSPEMCPPDRGWGGGDTARRYVKTSGNPEARRSVFNASSSSFTTMEDQAPPPNCCLARMKVCSVRPASSKGTPKRRPKSSAKPKSLQARSMVKPIL